jgi:hypothetical protein
LKIDEVNLKWAVAWWKRNDKRLLQEEELVRIWSTPWPALVQEVKRVTAGQEPVTPNTIIPISLIDVMPPVRLLCDNVFFLPLALHLFGTETDEVRRKVNIVGLERLDEALTSCGRVSLIGGHVGPALATTYVLNLLGYTISHHSRRNFYEHLKLPRHETITHIPTVGFHLASLARAMADLEAGRIVFTAGDGRVGTSGRSFDFLGKSRKFQSGFGYATTRCKAEAIPVFARLDSDGNLTIEFGDLLCPIADKRPDHERQERIVSEYVAALEKYWLTNQDNVRHGQFRLYASLCDYEQSTTAQSLQVCG